MRLLARTVPALLRRSPHQNPIQSTALFRQPGTLSRTMATAAGKRLAGKTIVITGASSGIGRSTALEFARTSPENLRLILTARREDALQELAAEIKKEVGDGVKVLPVKLDVSDANAVRGFVGNLPEEWRDINVLVNNALVLPQSHSCSSAFMSVPAHQFHTNLSSLHLVASSRVLPRPPRSMRMTLMSCSRPTSPASST